MEQERINIAALLKDCPKGTKLYSPLFGECELFSIIETKERPIIVAYGISYIADFDECGHFEITYKDGECLLFPSKEVRDWSYFRVKYAKGVEGKGEEIKALLESNGGIDRHGHGFDAEDCIYYIDRTNNYIEVCSRRIDDYRDYILSTGTELRLEEKEEPEFEVGDVVVNTQVTDCDKKTNERRNQIGVVSSIKDDSVTIRYWRANRGCIEQWIDPEGFYRPATPEEIAKWNEETLHPNRLHYSQSKRKFVHWFLVKDEVLVKDDNYDTPWNFCLFSHHTNKEYPYFASGAEWKHCLPYNGQTAMLLGTTKDWEEAERLDF